MNNLRTEGKHALCETPSKGRLSDWPPQTDAPGEFARLIRYESACEKGDRLRMSQFNVISKKQFKDIRCGANVLFCGQSIVKGLTGYFLTKILSSICNSITTKFDELQNMLLIGNARVTRGREDYNSKGLERGYLVTPCSPVEKK